MTDKEKSFLIGEWSIPGAGSNQHNFRAPPLQRTRRIPEFIMIQDCNS
jgi:hypothetical protein